MSSSLEELENTSLAQPDEDYVTPEEKPVTPEEAKEFRATMQNCKFQEELADAVQTFGDKHYDTHLLVWAGIIRKPGELPGSLKPDNDKDDYGIINKFTELVDVIDPNNPEDIIMHLSPDKETELREVIQGCGAGNMADEVRRLGEKWGNQKLLKQAEYIKADDLMRISHQYSLHQYHMYLTGRDS